MKKSLIIFITIITTGCAGLETEFSCQSTTKGTCQTVSEANRQGKQKIKNFQLINSKKSSDESNLHMIKQNGMNTPSRTTESIYKIWIAPYVDDKDNFHSEQNIFFINEQTKWKGIE